MPASPAPKPIKNHAVKKFDRIQIISRFVDPAMSYLIKSHYICCFCNLTNGKKMKKLNLVTHL